MDYPQIEVVLEEIGDYFRVRLVDNIGEHTKESLEKTVEKILKAIEQNPQITIKQLEGLTDLTRRGVEWNLSQLKENGIINRIGPDKGGYWEVIK